MYLCGCARSKLQNCSMRTHSCSLQDLVPCPGIEPTLLILEGRVLTTGPSGKSSPNFLNIEKLQRKTQSTIILSTSMHAKLLQSCQILCDPMDCSPPGSSVHGIPQPRILQWVAMSSLPSTRDHPDQHFGIFPGFSLYKNLYFLKQN